VQTGLGATGRMWCYQHFGFEPDAICFGKKTQVCGCLVGPRVDEIEKNCFRESSRINSTWGGSTVDMVRASQYIKVIEKDGLVKNAATLGEHGLSLLRELQSQFAGKITNARGRGLFMAIDLADPAIRPALLKKCFDNGMLILPTGVKGIRFRPSLIVTRQEIDQAVEILARSLREAIAL
jgi:L-lysine 6-transaminase